LRHISPKQLILIIMSDLHNAKTARPSKDT
jgi:hypothetical protein